VGYRVQDQPGLHSKTLCKKKRKKERKKIARCLWLMPIVLATQEAELRRIKV
jgi:hypothetical protein